MRYEPYLMSSERTGIKHSQAPFSFLFLSICFLSLSFLFTFLSFSLNYFHYFFSFFSLSFVLLPFTLSRAIVLNLALTACHFGTSDDAA
jgi:hypothetical protein